MSGCNNQCDYQNMRQAQIFAAQRQMHGEMKHRHMPCDMDDDFIMDSFPVGMTYVPWQKWQNIYDAHEGLSAGTIFKDLDLRFYGVRGCKR